MPAIAIALIIAAALGGGTAVAAQHSTPGDVLWGFKTHVNEGVESALAFSSQDKANIDIALAQERLAEAQQLAGENKLDTSAQAELNANFSAHAHDVAAQIAKLQAAGQYQAAADIAAKFQSTLADESSVIASVSANGNAKAETSLAPILTTVRTELDDASTLRANASAQAAGNTPTQASSNGASEAAPVRGLRIYTGGDASASTSDSNTSANADGSVHVINY